MKRFFRNLARIIGVRDWFNWFLLTGYVFFGVIGGLVWSEIAKAARG